MDAGGSKGKAKSEINVTPLIDIVLVLLIVFIVLVPGLIKARSARSAAAKDAPQALPARASSVWYSLP